MVQHIVLLEESRIGDEIVVNGVVANLDGRVLHHRIQVHGLCVAGSGIYFRVHFSGQYVMQRYTIYAQYFGAKINIEYNFQFKIILWAKKSLKNRRFSVRYYAVADIAS